MEKPLFSSDLMIERTPIGKILSRLRDMQRTYSSNSLPIRPQPEIPEDGETRKPHPGRDPEGSDEGWEDVYRSMGVKLPYE